MEPPCPPGGNLATASQADASLYRRVYALGLLVLFGTCSWTDRQLFSILLQPIKNEFKLSDTQLGLLGGTAFGLFYVTVGLPVAWLADRGNRRNIIAFRPPSGAW